MSQRKKNKKQITIQLPPMLISRIWQWGKDQGLPKQVAIQELIELGFKFIELKSEDHDESSNIKGLKR